METVRINEYYTLIIDREKEDIHILQEFSGIRNEGKHSRSLKIAIGDFETILNVALLGTKVEYTPNSAENNEPF